MKNVITGNAGEYEINAEIRSGDNKSSNSRLDLKTGNTNNSVSNKSQAEQFSNTLSRRKRSAKNFRSAAGAQMGGILQQKDSMHVDENPDQSNNISL